MKFAANCNAIKTFLVPLLFIGGIQALNLTCYQCIRNTNSECTSEELLPCPSISDRCVTHISKNAEKGFSIKRECGLGPCGFDDVMANKGLGMDICDRSRHEYFCIFCCRESGCNKSVATLRVPSRLLLLITPFIIIAVQFSVGSNYLK